MPERDLKLNSLSRFSKQSTRLVLEDYSSCEVPAGCGGVVLRWRNPDEPIPMVLSISSWNGKRNKIALDGEDISSSAKIPVMYGTHVLTTTITDFDPEYALLLLVGTFHEDYVRVLHLQGDTNLLSLPDGTWKYSLDPPQNENWQQPDFDDSGWNVMVEKPFGPLPNNWGGTISQWTKRQTDKGAKGLGIVTAEANHALVGEQNTLPIVSIRKRFTIGKNDMEGQP